MDRSIDELTGFATERLKQSRPVIDGPLVIELARDFARISSDLGVREPPKSRDELLGYACTAPVREAMLAKSATLRAVATTSPGAVLNLAGVVVRECSGFVYSDSEGDSEELAVWRARLRRQFAKELREEGFEADEIQWIFIDSLFGWWGIVENLWRLYKARRAYGRAREQVGPPPE